MGITNIIALIGGIALFLFGMNLMGDGLKKVAGSRLEVILYKLTSNPLKGILLGTGVTAVIQSSSATSVMVVGFVNSGMMKVKQAIGTIMGAIIGTSITGWVICLSSLSSTGSGIFEIISTDTLTTLLAIAGIILLMFTKKEQNHHIAYIFLGFAVLMFGISAMTGAVYPLRESETFINLLTNFSNPLIGILLGIVFTSIIQSASAAVGILQALAVTGAIDFRLALPVIMGIAIGASVPVLLTALGANANGKRTALIYLMVDTFGVILFSIIFYGINAFVHFGFMDTTMTMVTIAALNTVFRAIIVLMLTPLIGFMEKIVTKLVKEKKTDREELRDVDRLEERFLDHPVLALEQARITMGTMANISKNTLMESIHLFDHYSGGVFNKVSELEEVVDTYEDKLGNYIVTIMKNELDSEQYKEVSMFLHSINDFERISDHAKNFAESCKEMSERKVSFSGNAMKEMNNLLTVTEEIIRMTVQAFTEDNQEAAYRIAPLEEITDNMCDQYKLNHIDRIKNGICEYEHGFIFNDMLTDLERISDHCSNIGLAVRMKHDEISDQHGMVSRTEIENEHDYKNIFHEYMDRYQLK